MKRPLLLLGGALLLAAPARAQSYQRQIAPKSVPSVAPAATVPDAPAPKAAPDSELLLQKLNGLVFVATPADVKKAGVHDKGATIHAPVPAPAGLAALASGFIGHPLTRGDLNRLIRDIVLFYRVHDRPVVDVIVPEQDITTGTVQVVLLEGKVGKVEVTGNRWFPSREIDSAVGIQSGDTIRASRLQDDLDWVNQNPFHSTQIVYHPGDGLGQTDLELQTQDRFPARVYTGYENSGNAATGLDRYEAGFNWGDAFFLGQQLNYQYTTSGDGDSLQAHSGSYIVPLPWRNTLTFFGSYTETRGTVPPLVGINGRSYQLSARYSVPLPTVRIAAGVVYKETISAGFDHKYNKNALQFGNLPAGGTLYAVEQFALDYNGVETDRHGQTTLDDTLYYSPGNWGGDNADADFSAAHTGASADYFYNTLALDRLTRLPWDWSLDVRGTLQNSSGNLAPSEQLNFAGYGAVRGYETAEVTADEGCLLSVELRTPDFSLGSLFGLPAVKDRLQFLTFWDYGMANNHTALSGEPGNTPLSSVGAGVRYNVRDNLSVRFDYGFQLMSVNGNGYGSAGEVGVILSY